MPAPAATADLPPTCSVKDWIVFGAGVPRGEFYSPQRCRQIVANFDRLTTELRHTVPQAGIGHDRQQRFARSLGFPSVGQVTGCRLVPGYEDSGYFALDVDNVPTEVGGEINAGRLPSGSIELRGGVRDPEDPAREVPGDVLTGVAFLGEEQPAYRTLPPELQERSRPRATFADGTPVPPNPSPARWLAAMADVTRALAQEYRAEYLADRAALRLRGREYSAREACFSDFTPPPGPTPMTPDEIKAKLAAAGKTPEEIDAILAALGVAAAPPAVPPTNPTMSDPAQKPPAAAMGDLVVKHDDEAAMGAMAKKYADDPAAGPMEKMFAKMYADMQEQKKRVGELQASADMGQKKADEAAMAAFSADLDARAKQLARKVPPVALEALKAQWAKLYAPTAKAFSSEADRVKAFSDEVAGYLARPDDARLATAPGAAVTGPSTLSGSGLKLLDSIKDVNPRVYQKHTAGAA
jgi:hypothetical protein